MNLKLNFQAAEPLYLQIEHFLRRQIENGHISPGERLQPTDSLAREWKVGVMAVQQAMNRLAADGLIERKPQKGTFVKARMPSVDIAIFTGANLTDESEHFRRLIVNQIRDELKSPEYLGWNCGIYDNLKWKLEHLSPNAIKRFSSDLRNLKGGIAISFNPDNFSKKFLLSDFPFVAMNFSAPEILSDIELDYHDFGFKSVEFAAKKGAKKIAYFRTLGIPRSFAEDIKGMAEASKIYELPEFEVYQLQTGVASQKEEAYRKTLELLELWQTSGGPDAIIISDDVVAQFVALALMRGRLDGQNADNNAVLISMANDGINLPYVMPLARYDIPTRKIAKTLLKILRARIFKEMQENVQVRVMSPDPIAFSMKY